MINVSGLLRKAEDHLLYGQTVLAANRCRTVLAHAPDNVEAWCLLGKIARKDNDLNAAVEHWQTAIGIEPSIDTLLHLWEVLPALGRMNESIDALRQAVDMSPDDQNMHSNLLITQLLLPDLSLEAMYAEIRRWHDRHGYRRAGGEPLLNHPDAARKLRVGYVSGYLRQLGSDSIWLQILPVLQNHDPDQVEIFIYGDCDFQQSQLGAAWPLAQAWRSLNGLSDSDAAALIRRDGIDVLVSLIGHTGRDRITAFVHRAAPVQVSFHGMITTGVEEMDYWLGDAIATPQESGERFDESLFRLPNLFCFAPIPDAPEVAPLPAHGRDGHVTFGCFNVRSKISPQAVEAMAMVLRQVPGSRLILKSRGNEYASRTDCEAITDLFVQHGIAAERIEMLPVTKTQQQHLASYNAIDIALDTFPYCGCLTTYDALWMGVPTVALTGDRFVYRMSQAVLTTAGLGHLVAASRDEYVFKAVALAGDLEALAETRASLREAVLNSPLCDTVRFTGNLEAAYRHMWRDWCASPKSHASE